MEPVLIATNSSMTDVCAIDSFELDMVIGHDRQDFTACFEPIDGIAGGSLLYIDGTEFGGVIDDVTSDTESGLVEYHGRTWDGILACKRIMPPDDSAYRTVTGEANAVLASLITLLGIGDVFAASSEDSEISISYQFDRFADAYSGIFKMLQSAGAKLLIRKAQGKAVLSAVAAQTIEDEADSDLIDFQLTKTNRTVNHLVCAGTGEGTERIILHLYADASGNVSQTQTLFGIDEITDFYDYNNADETKLLEEGTKKLKEYQTQGSLEITGIGQGDWDIGDKLVARDNRSGTVISAPIMGKTVNVNSSTNWHLHVGYEVGEASRSASGISGNAEMSYVFGVKGDAEEDYRAGNVNLTPSDIGAVELDGGGITDAAAFCDALGVGDVVSNNISSAVSVATNTYKSIGSVTLGAGTWVVMGNAIFASNATGKRFINLNPTANDYGGSGIYLRMTSVGMTALSNDDTRMHTSMIVTHSSSTTYYLNCWQNSGSALNCTGYIRAVRIAS